MFRKSAEDEPKEENKIADIPLGAYLRGYRANLHARTLALGVACVLGGGVIAAEAAGPATAANPTPVRCTESTLPPQETCRAAQDEEPGRKGAVVATLLGVCITGGGAMLCAIAGSPEDAVPTES